MLVVDCRATGMEQEDQPVQDQKRNIPDANQDIACVYSLPEPTQDAMPLGELVAASFYHFLTRQTAYPPSN